MAAVASCPTFKSLPAKIWTEQFNSESSRRILKQAELHGQRHRTTTAHHSRGPAGSRMAAASGCAAGERSRLELGIHGGEASGTIADRFGWRAHRIEHGEEEVGHRCLLFHHDMFPGSETPIGTASHYDR